MNAFKDHFSAASGRYAAYRPDCPAALFAWLVGLCAARDTAWDCATGSGQAAHWFDLPRFYAEAARVLKPGGVLALWGYGRMGLPGDMSAPCAERAHPRRIQFHNLICE